MHVYKKMYLRLFIRVTDAIELLRRGCAEKALQALITAQQETEEIFLSEPEQRQKGM